MPIFNHRLFSAFRAVCVALFCIMVPLSAFSMSCATFCSECDDPEKCENSIESFCNCPNGVQSCTVDEDSLSKDCNYYYDRNLFGDTLVPSCTCVTVSSCRVMVYYREAAGCSAMSAYTQSKTGTNATITLAPPTWAQIKGYGCSAPPTGTYLAGWCTNSSGCSSSSYTTGSTISCSGSSNRDVYLYPYYVKCPNGTYSNNGVCTQCPAGSYCVNGIQYACGAGRWSNAGASSCSSINAGCYGTSASKACPYSCPSLYPNSVAGSNGSIETCYSNSKSRAWSGSQTACTKPANAYTVTCNSCSIAACSYVAYSNSAGTGDGTIKSGCSSNSGSCTQTVASVTCNSNYYVNGTACSACSGVGDGSYTKSVQGNSGGAGACFKACTKACTQQSKPSGAYAVTHGNSSTSGQQYYGGSCNAAASTCSITVTSCAAGYYKSGNSCPSCSGLGGGFYPNSIDGNTVGTSACKTNSITGKYVKSANATSATNCAPGTYKGEHQVAYGSTSSCATCSAGYYCPEGASSQSACTGRTKYSAAGASACSTVSSGYYTTNCNSSGNVCTGQSQCTGTTYCSGGIKYDCPSGYTADTSNGKTAATQCKISVSGGKYLTTKNTTTTESCSAGYYKAAHTVAYGSTSSCSACSGRTKYSGTGASSCSTVSSGYYTDGCNSSGNACTKQIQCTGATYCSGGIQYNCPSGYTANTSSGKTAASQCTISVSGGKYLTTKNTTTTASCSPGYYKAAHTVAYGSTSSCSACSGRTKYSGTGASACSDVTTGYYTTGCNSSNNACTGQSACGSNAYYCSGGIRYSVTSGYYSTGGSSTTRTGQKQCTAGTYCSGGVSYSCPAGRYGSSAGLTTDACSGSCKAGYYCPAGSTTSTAYECPDGYGKSDAGAASDADCYLTTTKGNYIATKNSATQTKCTAN
ncbi:MAG: hypothetical protein IKJ62_00745, partial [Alphaproteobacteria bacterium]|nr:hypothetical protein [Alphaproteobacteria bacterium]